ncbi:MAG TPA: ABC transporter ATP-binding protein, partial [Ilumatobacteraceae bacterium]|nr:ABC transporter ATP-binding protein [Ilumatobacteraceae bacterium]
ALARDGLGVLLVEQQINLALRSVDRGYVLRDGVIVVDAPAAELRQAGDVLAAAYLGNAVG